MGKQIPSKIGHYRDGLYRRNVKRISTATTGFDIPVAESGMTYFVPTWTTGRLNLPRISSKWLGLEYTFFIEEQASSDDISFSNDKDSSAIIQMNFSSAVDNSTGASPGSTFATAIRLTAVSSIVWMGQSIMSNSYTMSSAANTNLSGWAVGVSS